jgi:hypothetical protein
MEPIWQDVKVHKVTQRSDTEVQGLKRATDGRRAEKQPTSSWLV